MLPVLNTTLEQLFDLLGYTVQTKKDIVRSIAKEIEQEALKEAKNGVGENIAIESLNKVQKILGKRETFHILEAVAARVLVNFFAEHKRNYSEQQKEVFLTFLLTNKLKRELEKSL